MANFTDTKQQLLSMTESKNRYQKEFMKANKTIVEHKERKEPENVFVDGLVSKIKMLKSTNSNPWQRNMK